MKIIEIRKKLIHEIKLSDNKYLLEEFYNYLNQENKVQKPYTLNKEQNAAINEARTQVKNGNFLTNEQADQEIEEWLNK